MIRHGYACKTLGVPGAMQRGLTLAGATPHRLREVSLHNLNALEAALEYCGKNGIGLFRVSSDIIPFGSHSHVSYDWKSDCREALGEVARAVRNHGVRVSMHPGQYTVLNSPRSDVVRSAVADLVFHADFLDAIEADASACIVLHAGGVYGERKQAMARFVKECKALPEHVRSRLALENDERNYAIDEVLDLCGELGLPAIFDVFHHSIRPAANGEGDVRSWLDQCGRTWSSKARQKIHYSQQQEGSRAGVHSQTITIQPFLEFHAMLEERDLDVMLEVKDKNLSAQKCINLTSSCLPARRLTDEWARYKYLVLEHSQKNYLDIRALMRGESPLARDFYTLLEEALSSPVNPGQARNAAEHVWGYVSGLAEPAEKKRILADLESMRSSGDAIPRLKRKLFALAEKHHSGYLLHSLYFYL